MATNKKMPAPVAAETGADAGASNAHTQIISQDTGECNKQQPNLWAILPARVRYDKELTPNAKLIYAEVQALTQAEGYCWASNAYLAELYGMSTDNVGRLIAQLEKRGYITREIVRDPETNAVTGRKIWCNLTIAGLSIPPCKNADPSPQNCGDSPCKKAGENNININNNIPPVSPEGESGQAEPEEGERKSIQDTLFASFWDRYPARHGRKNGKAQARKVWDRLKVTAKVYDAIMAGLEDYLASDEVRRDYAMDAARWLRGRRWEDEVVQLLSCQGWPVQGDLLPGERPEDYQW